MFIGSEIGLRNGINVGWTSACLIAVGLKSMEVVEVNVSTRMDLGVAGPKYLLYTPRTLGYLLLC